MKKIVRIHARRIGKYNCIVNFDVLHDLLSVTGGNLGSTPTTFCSFSWTGLGRLRGDTIAGDDSKIEYHYSDIFVTKFLGWKIFWAKSFIRDFPIKCFYFYFQIYPALAENLSGDMGKIELSGEKSHVIVSKNAIIFKFM